MQSSETFHQLLESFPKLSHSDLSVIFHSKQLAEQDSSGDLQEFIEQLETEHQILQPAITEWSPDRTTVRYQYKISGNSLDSANKALIHRINTEYIPQLLNSRNIQGYLSGKVVYDINQEDKFRRNIPLVFSSILCVSFLFLLVAFESIVIPIKAMILNLLSSAAAFGFLVLTFQIYGWEYGVIESFVPSLLFSILFGLSMDYHLFLLSSIQEKVRQGIATTQAVQEAIAETSGVISSAAVIMASVFVVISLLDLPLMKQLGLGLAFAVVIDATIIRGILLPASVVLLGELNWYLPPSIAKPLRALKLRLGLTNHSHG